MSLHMCIQKDAVSSKSLHIATSDISQEQNWCFDFKKVQYRLCLCICVFKTVQYRPSRCILLHLIYHKDIPGVVYSKWRNIALCLCILLHLIYHKDKTGVIQNDAISPMYLHIPASDIPQGQNWHCVFNKEEYRLCLCILLHLIYHKDKTGIVYSTRWNIAFVFAYCCIWYITRTKLVLFKTMQYRLCICILLRLIYHKDKTGVVYSTRWNIAFVFAYYCIWYITRTKLVLCIQQGRISPLSLHIAASDISQGQNWYCVFNKVKYRLCLCIFLRLIYHKDKTGIVYSTRWNIAFVFAYCCIWYITRTKLVLFKTMQYRLCICILLRLIYHKDKTGIVYSTRWNIAFVFANCCVWYITRTKLMLCIQQGGISPLSLHIPASDISQGQNWCCVFNKVEYRLRLCILLLLIYHKDKTDVVYSTR